MPCYQYVEIAVPIEVDRPEVIGALVLANEVAAKAALPIVLVPYSYPIIQPAAGGGIDITISIKVNC